MWNSGGVHPFTGCHSGLKIQEMSHVNKDYTPFIVLLFMEVIKLLVTETKKYCVQYLDTHDNGKRHNFQM